MSSLSVTAANAILDDNFAPWVLATGIAADAVGADTAMVIALAAASVGFRPCTTVDLTINYMRPITKADAVIEAKVMRLGRTLAFCTCELREADAAKPAAFATGTYAILV